jgi:hypothetical protein
MTSYPGCSFKDAVNPSLEAPCKTSMFCTALKEHPGQDVHITDCDQVRGVALAISMNA